MAYPDLDATCGDGPPIGFANATYYLVAQADAYDDSNAVFQFGQFHKNTTVASHSVTCDGAGGYTNVQYWPTQGVSGVWSMTLPSFSMTAYSWWSFYVGLAAYNSANATGDASSSSYLNYNGVQGYSAEVNVTSITCPAC